MNQHAAPKETNLTPAQASAVDISQSVWVTASAGTGKTQVLSERVLRLLLAGTPPSAILCITYTKAAAAEMLERVQGRLRGWMSAEESELETALASRDIPVTPESKARARRLFLELLEATPGIRVQTIHSFCQSLLRRFPLEAGISPDIQVMEEGEAKAMTREVLRLLLAGELNLPPAVQASLDAAWQVLADESSEHTLDEWLSAVLAQRETLESIREEGLATSIKRMLTTMGLSEDALGPDLQPPPMSSEAWYAPHGGHHMDREALLAVAAIWETVTTKQKPGWAAHIKRFIHSDNPGSHWQEYAKVFLTKDGDIRADILKLTPDKPDYPIRAEAHRVKALDDHFTALRMVQRSATAMTIGLALQEILQTMKHAAGRMDYTDLLHAAARLLTTQNNAWVMYKLDAGIEHLLLDEAQDTSPQQWQIVEALTSEWTSGESTARTLFVVGDPKQSIYGFQGADAAYFHAVAARTEQRFQAAAKPYQPIRLEGSFRTSATVLEWVDRWASNAEDALGQTAIHHQLTRVGQAGHIELWPPILQPEKKPKTAEILREYPAPEEASSRLGRVVASLIHHWLETRRLLPARGRPVEPGDILILARKRKPMPAIIDALRREGIDVAGADRLSLHAHILTRDALALAAFALLPDDDLNLAALLKSPWCGLDEEALFQLAAHRDDASLWQALQARRDALPYATAHEWLKTALSIADYRSPSDFYHHLLSGRGQAVIQARFGEEGEEWLQEWWRQLTRFEQTETPSLQAFLGWMEGQDSDIRRETESGLNAVRLMTVHGSKGLQAPIVILLDPVQTENSNKPKIWEEGGVLYWAAGQACDTPLLRRLRERESQASQAEDQRLLYVALTRAEDELYVLPALDGKTKNMNSRQWASQLRGAMEGWATEQPIAEPGLEESWFSTDLPRLVVKTPQIHEVAAKSRTKTSTSTTAIALPGWLTSPPPVEPMHHAQSPSQPPPGQSPASATTGWRARERGIALHALLCLLPGQPHPEARARQWMERAQIPASERESLWGEAHALLSDLTLNWIFQPGGKSEAPIAGEVGGVFVQGRIDRLVIEPKTVWLIDFKSGSAPATMPAPYQRQLQTYASLLRPLYPTHALRAGLLWTASREWTELPLTQDGAHTT